METAGPSLSPIIPPSRRIREGFSVMELVVLIAILGVLITVVVTMMGTQPTAVRNAKLASDVATLNQMVSIYVSDGGRLAGLTNAQTVLDRLKKGRPQAEWKQHTGPVSGRLVDMRLMARTTTAPEKNGQERAKWNSKTMRFELTTQSGNAVSEFYLDEALSGSQPGTEKRDAPVVQYNSVAGKNQGWVWGYSATGNIAYNTPGSNDGKGASKPFDPTQAAPVPDPGDGGDDGGGNNGGGDDDGGDDGPTAPAIKQLPKPKILPDGNRSFAYTAFPASAAISPKDPSDSKELPGSGSRLEYRLNGGEWKPYSGSPISLTSGDKIEARNFATDTSLYRTSSLDSDTYYRLVSGFSGNGTGTWGNAAGGSNLITAVQNGTASSTFQHGNTKLDLGNGEFLDAGVENVLTFTPEQFETITPDVWFDLGNLVMLNGNTFYNSEASGVTLSINLNLTEPAHSTVVHINLGLISTENTSDKLASADIVELRNPNTDFKVTVDGVEYRLELGWESLDSGAGVVQGNQFYIYETATASAVLRGRFVPNK